MPTVTRLIKIDFDNMENHNPRSETTVGVFIGAAQPAFNAWAAKNKPACYVGYDGSVYPQFQLVTDAVLSDDTRDDTDRLKMAHESSFHEVSALRAAVENLQERVKTAESNYENSQARVAELCRELLRAKGAVEDAKSLALDALYAYADVPRHLKDVMSEKIHGIKDAVIPEPATPPPLTPPPRAAPLNDLFDVKAGDVLILEGGTLRQVVRDARRNPSLSHLVDIATVGRLPESWVAASGDFLGGSDDDENIIEVLRGGHTAWTAPNRVPCV